MSTVDAANMAGQTYLEGATPYPPDVIDEYVTKGYWENVTYGDILDRAVAAAPDKVAIIDANGLLTYRQLAERVDRLAIALLELGVKKYDRILLQLPNRHECVVAFFAMQRIGAVPVPATARHQYREVSHFFELTEPAGWIVPARDSFRDFRPLMEEVRGSAPSLKHLIVLDDGETLPPNALSFAGLIAGVDLSRYQPDYLRQFRPDPNDVFIIFPTGGTTGMPKGVPRTHNCYLASVRTLASRSNPLNIRGLATPIGHGMAYQGTISSTVYLGATMALIASPRAPAILEAIEQHRITQLSVVSTQLEDILSHPDLVKYDLTSLKTVGSSGDRLRPETAQKAKEYFASIGAQFGGCAFGSTEGPTARHDPDEPLDVFCRSVGKPISDGDHWKVIDEHELELQPGTPGELAVKGPNIFTGYYRSDAGPADVFTADGYYKTGDLGMIDEQGYIYITGRKKDVIKRGGEGVAPTAIESLLYQHPAVQAVAVVAMPDKRLGEKACAYLVLKPGRRLTLKEATSFLKGLGAGILLLPERLEIVDELPLTPLGKIDKKTLRQDIQQKVMYEEEIQSEDLRIPLLTRPSH